MSRATQIDLLLVPLYDYRTNSLCSGYTVNFYAAGTTTPKNVWTEVGKVTPVTTRTLSSSGTVQVYGDGIYKIVVLDTDAATVYSWDYVKAQANTFTVQSKSGTYTATADDDIILVDTTAAGVTINLATVVGFTHPLTIKLSAGANDVTVDAYTTETIDGELTITLNTDDDSATLYPDVTGETWYRADRFAGLTATIAEINSVCDGNTATAAEIVKAADGIGVTIPRTVVVSIGAWDMDATASMAVELPAGVAFAKVVGIETLIFVDDMGSNAFPIDTLDSDYATPSGALNLGAGPPVVVNLFRNAAGRFDNVSYDSVAHTRGYVTVFYID